MAVLSKDRGWDMVRKDGEWFYVDTGEPTVNNRRPCGYCMKNDTEGGHDGCLGTIPHVMNACCGHGIDKNTFVQFWSGKTIRGKSAVEWLMVSRSGFKELRGVKYRN